MSIFDTLKNAIFGHAANASPASTAAPAPSTTAATSTPPPASAPSGTAAPAAAPVDVEKTLNDLKAKSGQNLNWQTSIVDLMKLVGMDSSLQHRKDLAKELGYTGNPDDSATMNIWLHKQVMARLAQNGGKVPDSLLH